MRAAHEKVLGTIDRTKAAIAALLAEDEVLWTRREQAHAEQLQEVREALKAAQEANNSEALARAIEALRQSEATIQGIDNERRRLTKELDEAKLEYQKLRAVELQLQVQLDAARAEIAMLKPQAPQFSMRASNGEPIPDALSRLRQRMVEAGQDEARLVELVLPDAQYPGVEIAGSDHEWWAQRTLRLSGIAGTGSMIVAQPGQPNAIRLESQAETDRRCVLELQDLHVHGPVDLSAKGGIGLRLLGVSTLHSRPAGTPST